MNQSEEAKHQERMARLAEFSDRAFIKRALRTPDSPTAVLSFMFGVDFLSETALDDNMRSGQAVLDMRGHWFGGVDAFDELCQPFRDLVRAAGRGKLIDAKWNQSVNGKMAQLVLCDQLSRSIFRGTEEAFAYDEQSLMLGRQLAGILLQSPSSDQSLRGEFFPPYFVFLLTALMHSESVDDHAQLQKIVTHADLRSPSILHDWFALMRTGGDAHTRVVERFGRYPHRNAAKGRRNTPDEDAWLADVDNLPGWAKSQLVKKSSS